ncbi:YicC family protein [Geobacter sp. FeAm09]|uniref:YicC/YloC family endoribonuclease n=1 Tax=Geobacter sp. FeAm09 TaxID=2597769 RepID=UPI0011ED7BB6|nr:YicC/YloC family endoribonuclease [Geobacter sp. FeAm09]QEM68781.1 YicC family protein [Geobacter sp. FeAm09]
MLKSMTGYGKGEATTEQGTFTVEIRSVNHRYGEVSVRMPRGFMALENEVKRAVSAQLKRGKIDVFVQWEEALAAESLPQVDTALARSYFTTFNHLAGELGLLGQVPLSLVIAQKGVLREGSTTLAEDDYRDQLMSAVQAAVTAMDAMRTREGEALAADLSARRAQVAEWTALIRERTPAVVVEYRQKLKARLDQLLEGTEMDETRLAQEVALMADRCDVTEELVRLASHFGQFDEALRLPEPVGRKLDFLMQEMNREVNTIGSKSSDAEITSLVIRIKAEMEKMREQVQNIE